jgi:ABC-type nickel/cobalt efflux system permease component RcnA
MMEEFGLLLVFWYGVLHAFGPDHLSGIIDFSLGKSKKKTLFITMAFAIGHGVMLFLFAKILQHIETSESITAYGDSISASVIILMGIYLLYMVANDRVQLRKHMHEDKEHVHIWFGKEHTHSNKDMTSAFALGSLMGIGGVRGMLVTLSLVGTQDVTLNMVAVFSIGVMLVFMSFGLIILYINQNLLSSKESVRVAFALAGATSIIVGSNILI